MFLSNCAEFASKASKLFFSNKGSCRVLVMSKLIFLLRQNFMHIFNRTNAVDCGKDFKPSTVNTAFHDMLLDTSFAFSK